MRVASVGSLLSCAVLAGLTLAAAAFPAAALVGLAAKQGADSYEALPSDLQTPPTPQTTYVYADDGKTLITMFYDQNRHDVPLSGIGPVMQQAIVAAEDTRFYQRGAVDIKGILRALVANARGENTQGASTLTMQYVRNVLKNDPSLTPQQRVDATVDTLGRKIQEVRYATALEKKFSKSEILDRYLNIAYFGDGAYGIASASWHYFGKQPNQLTLPEAALLAGLVQSPDADNPATGNKHGRARAPRVRAGRDGQDGRGVGGRRGRGQGQRRCGSTSSRPRTTAPRSAARTTTGASSATTSASGGTTSRSSAPRSPTANRTCARAATRS